MLGALFGDIAGSRFERHNIKTKDFRLFTDACHPTDDSIMTLAIASALLRCGGDYTDVASAAIHAMQELGRRYPNAGYGGSFTRWLSARDPLPYHSWGNGSAMRVSPCAHAAESLSQARELAVAVTAVTHNHPEGIRGAEAVTDAVYLALHGCSKSAIRDHISALYYPMDFTLDEIRPDYRFDVSCQGSVPQALEAFFEADSFEDTIRNAISIGGDSDTIAAIAGSVAEAFYGIPELLRWEAIAFLDQPQLDILYRFEARFGEHTTAAEH